MERSVIGLDSLKSRSSEIQNQPQAGKWGELGHKSVDCLKASVNHNKARRHGTRL